MNRESVKIENTLEELKEQLSLGEHVLNIFKITLALITGLMLMT